MPIYGINPPAVLPAEFPCRVLDGTGREITCCVSVDTDTGECDLLATTPFGVPTGRLIREKRPLPISFVPAPTADPVPPTPDDFEGLMRAIYPAPAGRTRADVEGRHHDADALMCRVLKSLGYGAGVKVFESAERWYA